jgi:hypothetical protein
MTTLAVTTNGTAKRGKKGKRKNAVAARTKVSAEKGIYTAPSRVGHHLDKNGLNKVFYEAFAEIENARPHLVDP